MQSLRYGLGDYECHARAAIFVCANEDPAGALGRGKFKSREFVRTIFCSEDK